MRGLPIIVFAALFAYIACALPSLSRGTPLPARGTLRPRGFREIVSKARKGISKPFQLPNEESPSCKGKQKVAFACCDYPTSIQYVWENYRGNLISRKNSVNQVYMLKSKYKQQRAVIKVIPVIHDAIEFQVMDQVNNLQLVDQFLGFAIEENPRGYAIDISHINPPPLISNDNEEPFRTYFIIMPYMGDQMPAEYMVSTEQRNYIQELQIEAIIYYKIEYGMQIIDIKPENFVYKVKETRKWKPEKAEIVGWNHVGLLRKAFIKEASLAKIEAEKFCFHEPVDPVKPRAFPKNQ